MPSRGLFVKTRRERLRDLLSEAEEGCTLEDLREHFQVPRHVVLSDLRHLQLSLRHRDETLLMAPPRCKECGYEFAVEEPKAPSKCPMCKSVALADPVFKVAAEA